MLEEEMGAEPSSPLRTLASQIEKQLGFTAIPSLPAASKVPLLQAPFSLTTCD